MFGVKGLHMIRETSDHQLSLKDFIHPFGCDLSPTNRWVKLAEVIPWSGLEAPYIAKMSASQGRPCKPARLVVGALIIKHRLNLSDEEAVLQIQENPYLQFFCGFGEYVDAPPFVPSLFVEIRKRMGRDVFESFEQAIVEQARALQKRKHSRGKNDDHRTPPSASTSSEQPEQAPENASHQGRLLMDATVADQMIRFPTDLGLLNEAREISEDLIDELHKERKGKKPRTYRQQARKAYLSVSKRKRAGRQVIRRGIRQQLQYLRRNLGHIERMLDEVMGMKQTRMLIPMAVAAFPLSHKLQRRYWVIQHVYAQQKAMYDAKSNRCEDRIVSISQPHVRPIIRGKAGKHVEFGSKISVSMLGKLAFVDHLGWDAFNESQDLIEQVKRYRERFGFFPEVVLADGIYGTRKNRGWLKEHGIRFGGKPLGRPKKITDANMAEIRQLKRQRRDDERNRIPVEGKFGQGKNGYRLNQIRARLASTSEAWVRSIFLVMNLRALLRFLLSFLRLNTIMDAVVGKLDDTMRRCDGISAMLTRKVRTMMVRWSALSSWRCAEVRSF